MLSKSSEIPVVSIQCLAYNHEKYIRQCLDSILKQQTNFKFEVVVHDDCSTDNTANIIREYAMQFPGIIKPIYEEVNLFSKDVNRLRQVVNSQMLGKYIAICECDDYWTDPHKLQIQVDFLNVHQDYSMCFHSAKKQYDRDTVSWLDCENIEDRDYSATEVFVNWIIPTASILCRREAWNYRFHLKGGERILNGDISLVLSCMMKGKVRGMSRQMSVYRIQGGGVTYDVNAKKRRAMRAPHHFECLRDNFPIVDRKPLDDTIAKTYFERALVQDGFFARMKDLGRSLKNSPYRFLYMSAHAVWNGINRKK